MSTPKKNLTDQLTAAVAPHLGGDDTAAQPPKAVAKTLRQLAKQLTKQQSKQNKEAKAALKPTPLTAKRARKALAGELATVLQPFLGTEEEAAKAPKGVGKAVKRLTAELVKQRRKQAKQSAKQAKQADKAAKEDDPTDAAAVAAPKPKTKPLASRRSAPARRPATKAPAPTPPADASPAQ